MSHVPSDKEGDSEHHFPSNVTVISPSDVYEHLPRSQPHTPPTHSNDVTMYDARAGYLCDQPETPTAVSMAPAVEMHQFPPEPQPPTSPMSQGVTSTDGLMPIPTEDDDGSSETEIPPLATNAATNAPHVNASLPHYEAQSSQFSSNGPPLPAEMPEPYLPMPVQFNVPASTFIFQEASYFFYDRVSLHRVQPYIVETDPILSDDTRAMLSYPSLDMAARSHAQFSQVAFTRARHQLLEQLPSPFIYLSPSPAQREFALLATDESHGRVPPVLTTNNANVIPHTRPSHLAPAPLDVYSSYSRPPFASEFIHYQVTELFTVYDPTRSGFIPLSALLTQCLASALMLLPPGSQAALTHDMLSLYSALRDAQSPVHDKYCFLEHICPSSHTHIPDCAHGMPFTPASLVGFLRMLLSCYSYAQVHVISLAQMYDLLCLFYRVESTSSIPLPSYKPLSSENQLVVRRSARKIVKSCCCFSVPVSVTSNAEITTNKASAAARRPTSAKDVPLYMDASESETELQQCCGACSLCWRAKCGQRFTFPCFKRMFTRVEAQFGPAVVDFFYFTQSLLLLNIIGMLLMAVIYIPGMLEYNWSQEDLVFVDDSGDTIVVSQSLQGLLVGSGMEGSFMFYSDLYSPYFNLAAGIRMDLAWVFVCMAFLFVSLIDSLSRFSISSEAALHKTYMFSRTLYAGFTFYQPSHVDYQWQRTRLAIAFQTLQSQQEDVDSIHRSKNRFLMQKFQLGVRRVTGITLCIGFLTGCAYLVTWLILKENTIRTDLSSLSFAAEFVVPWCLTMIQLMIPYFVRFILNFERHDTHSSTFKHYVFRMFVMKMFFVLVVLFQTQSLDTQSSQLCLQTVTGVLYYRMLMVDFATDFLTCLFFPWLFIKMRRCILKKRYADQFERISRRPDQLTREEARESSFFKMLLAHDPGVLAKMEFDVAANTLDMIYRIALVWAAMPFSPVVPILAAFTYFGTIILKYYQVVNFTRTPYRPVAVMSQNNIFRTYLVATLCMMCIPFSFWLRQTVDCGPHDISSCVDGVCDDRTPLQAVLRWTDTLPNGVSTAVDFIQAPAFLWALLVLGIINVVYLSQLFSGHSREVAALADDVATERQEWQFLRLSAPDNAMEVARGKDMFIQCTSELPHDWGMRVQVSLQRRGLASMQMLKRMEPSRIQDLLRADATSEAETAMLKLIQGGLNQGLTASMDVVMELVRELANSDGYINVMDALVNMGYAPDAITAQDFTILQSAWEGLGGDCESCGTTPCAHFASPKLLTQQMHSYVSIAMTIVDDWMNKSK